MKRVAVLVTIFFSILSIQLYAQEAQDEIIGIWDAGERNVEIHKINDRYIGNPIDTLGLRRDDVVSGREGSISAIYLNPKQD